LFYAWELFRKGKRRRKDVMTFERHLEDNLFALQEELLAETYRHSPYEPFTIHDPKQRTIHKATVKDRVIHQAIINVIESLFEPRFIFDSYSCRVNKGTHAAVKRLRTFLRRASENNTCTVYALKCDIRKFFASVDHTVLKELLKKQIDSPGMIRILEDVIDSFQVAFGMGIPLGNLTSQLFANVYLHELDWFIKQKLSIKYYLRYCDDFVLLADSSKLCEELVGRIDTFLQEQLHMQLHSNKVHTRTWNQGVDFLGYVSLPHVTILRPSTQRRVLRNATVDDASSYLGLCKHADAYLIEKMIRNITSG
jgi:RNA-directed DNA polymerase